MKFQGLLFAACALLLASCSVPSSTDILSGCYYDGRVPVLRLRGNLGTILIPGDVQHVRFVTQPSEDYFFMVSHPGFELPSRGPAYATAVPSLGSPVFLLDREDAAGEMLVRTPEGVRHLAKRACS